MQEDWTTLKVIWQMLKGFIIALLVLTGLMWIIMSLVFDENKVVTTDLDQNHYSTEELSGFATSSTLRILKVYKRNSILPDEVVADLNMYVNGNEKVDVSFLDRRLRVSINHDVKMDTLINEGEKVRMNANEWSDLINKNKNNTLNGS